MYQMLRIVLKTIVLLFVILVCFQVVYVYGAASAILPAVVIVWLVYSLRKEAAIIKGNQSEKEEIKSALDENGQMKK